MPKPCLSVSHRRVLWYSARCAITHKEGKVSRTTCFSAQGEDTANRDLRVLGKALLGAGDGVMIRIRHHLGADLHMNEQIDRNSVLYAYSVLRVLYLVGSTGG